MSPLLGFPQFERNVDAFQTHHEAGCDPVEHGRTALRAPLEDGCHEYRESKVGYSFERGRKCSLQADTGCMTDREQLDESSRGLSRAALALFGVATRSWDRCVTWDLRMD